jgi:NAD(P)-dependent dehydrogenase (short-subunit alcohol dehydrogenase family)
LPDTFALPVDVSDAGELANALRAAEQRAGAPKVIVHNAVGGAFGTYGDIDPAILERNFQVNVMALLHLARWAAPRMIATGGGAILTTGNTSALRGKAAFAGFAPTKAAQRILAEAIARDSGPKGVHVAYILIDAVIDVPWTRQRFPDAADDFFIKPTDVANEAWHVAHQPRSAWSFLTELRPYAEKW